MSCMIIRCEKCGAYANIEMKETDQIEYCDSCKAPKRKYSIRRWLCFDCAVKYLQEKAKKNPKLGSE